MQKHRINVLIVCSGNSGQISTFIVEQTNSLSDLGVNIHYFVIKGFGVLGYLKNIMNLKRKIKEFEPSIIHAHYGYSGLLANLQRRIPVITTYHGSDINNFIPFCFSMLAVYLSKYNIFVSVKLFLKTNFKKKYSILSCGVDLDTFQVMDKTAARRKLCLDNEKKIVLFSSSFSNKVKNYPLAKGAINLLVEKGIDIELLEFKGYTRNEANILMNAVDCVLVTSFNESGPLVVKEAMAVNTCAVFVNVGDVLEIANNLEGYYLACNNPEDISKKIQSAISFNKRTKGRKRIIELGIDINTIAKKIETIYRNVLDKS